MTLIQCLMIDVFRPLSESTSLLHLYCNNSFKLLVSEISFWGYKSISGQGAPWSFAVTREPLLQERLSTVDLLVLTAFDNANLICFLHFTFTLIRKSIALNFHFSYCSLMSQMVEPTTTMPNSFSFYVGLWTQNCNEHSDYSVNWF